MARIGFISLVLVAGCYRSHSPTGADAATDVQLDVPDVGDADDPVVSLSVGTEHVCAVRQSGGLYCWGNGEDGQIGQGLDQSRAVPTRVEGLPPMVRVATDLGHVCAIDEEGGLWCWGRNNWRQIGSDFTVRSVPRPSLVERQDLWTDIGVGTRHTCAINRDGEVWCWGTNAEAQVAGLTSDLPNGPALAPLPSPAIHLDVHGKANCAVLTDGQVACWGGFMGHVGTSRIYRRSPFLFDLDAQSVAVGRGESRVDEGDECALTAAGTVYCWPRWSVMPSPEVPSPRQMAGLENVVDIDLGHTMACAVLENGDVRCWGRNFAGQLGNGTFDEPDDRARRVWPPTQVVSIDAASEVSTGDRFACALLRTGHVVCWGDGAEGQLGVAGAERVATPVRVSFP